MFRIAVAIIVLLQLAFCIDQSQLSDCLYGSLKKLIKIEKTYNYLFKNYDKICDLLESSAYKVQKCNPKDQKQFYHTTTFYRLMCTYFEEELEDHMPCLEQHAISIDRSCNKECGSPSDPEEQKKYNSCRKTECATICYFKKFSEACPRAKDVLYRFNMKQIYDLLESSNEEEVRNLHQDCAHLMDKEYMSNKLVGTIYGEKLA
uniref:CPG4 domain-containing protein n=1 Tax=Syphacia muris TaxID=451379 RepID=A0A158R492_9BILA